MTASPKALGMGIRDEVAALKKERIVGAAVELFYEHGYENTTLEAVAERLGVTKPFIYAHFNSKAALLAEICSRSIVASHGAIDDILAMEAPVSHKLKLFAPQFVRAVIENQKHFAIFAREEKNLQVEDSGRINDMRREFDHKLTRLIEEGVGSGDIDVSDPHLTALAIGGMVSWTCVWYRAAGRLSMAEIADEMSELVLSMTNARRSAATG